ncbi:chromosome partitioning protein [Micromonospora sp. Llam7]|uniref:chromosome partitioning protein n=1 Tax=Micromonospora tarapacensis TaxID=2835305 RepID=UPI001C83F7CF|nr:chromosome partitioning protein [Micromonospora tarapacensis]
MVDENADRVHVPGQHGVPERDIEPLWPPDQIDGSGPPGWAAPPPVPPAPVTGNAPSPADYPSLTGGVPAATGWEPEPAQVDLDLPFTLDRSTSVAPARDGAPAETGPPDSGTGEETDGVATTAAPGSSGGTGGSAGHGAAPPPARPPAESPWAHPPQRPAPDASAPAEADAGPARPSWAAAPLQPLPPVPQPLPQHGGPHPAAAPLPAPQRGSPPVPQHGAATGPDHHHPTPMPPAPPAPVPHPADGPPGPPYPGSLPPQAEPPYAAAPPGPFPPQPAWHPASWQQGTPVAHPVPQQSHPATNTASRMPPAYDEPAWSPEPGAAPTAEDFARRRQVRPADPVATMGVRAVVNKTGLVKLPPGRHEQELKRDIEMVRRNFGGLRQVTVVNPKGGAGKTVAILLLAMTFGQKRGGYVLAWDNNETQGTLGMRAQQDFHSRTVRDLLRDLGQFHGAHGRVGDLSQYVRSQSEGMFDVLASDESATGGEMLTAAAFGEIREVVSRFYKLIFVDTGNNVRAQNWQAAMDATDQLVVTMSARNDSAETAARMLDHLEQSGRQRLVRQAVTVVSMPPSRKEIDLPAIQEHFAARTRTVLLAPYERLIDTGEPLRYAHLSAATRDAWLKIAAAVAEGL